MPKVPAYNEFAVTERALPAARQDSVATTKLYESQGDDFLRTGGALQRAGGVVADIAGKMQDRENADTLFRAEVAFKDELIQHETEQRGKRGAVALADGGVTVQTDKWFGEAAQKHSGVLTNDAQRRVFGELTGKLRLQAMHSMSQHQANEARASLTDSTNASIVGAINRAAANPNDWTVLESERADIRKRVQVLGQINGHDKATQDALVGEKLTLLHKQMVQQLVVSNPGAAKDYFEKYKDDIDGSQRAEIGQYAAKAAATSIGDGAATAAWGKHKPQSRADAVRLADMEEEIRNTLKGNDEAIEKGIKGLRERATAYKDQRKEEGNALEAGVNALLLGGASSGQVRKSAEFIKLSAQDPEGARKVDTYMENRDYTRVARAAASEQRADAAEGRAERRRHRDTLDTSLRVSDPAVLAAMTRNEVVNLLPILGSTSTAALVAKYDTLVKDPNKLREAKIDKQDFDTIALSAGLRPNEKSKSEDEKDRLVRLQSQVENVIDAEQRGKKRTLTRDEKTVIMQREIDNAVMVGRFFPDKRPVAVLTQDEQTKAYVEVGPAATKVKLTDIPANFRMQATKSRSTQGLPTTEAQMAELWLRSQGKYK